MENKLMVARHPENGERECDYKRGSTKESLGIDGAALYLEYIVTQTYMCGKMAHRNIHTHTYRLIIENW